MRLGMTLAPFAQPVVTSCRVESLAGKAKRAVFAEALCARGLHPFKQHRAVRKSAPARVVKNTCLGRYKPNWAVIGDG